MNTLEKLYVVQQQIKAPKGQYNGFGGYKYRNCEDILEAVKPVLDKVKAIIVLSDELVQIGDRYYVKANASFIDIEATESNILSNTAYAREEDTKKGMDGSQITGASSSYARKYALNGLLAIDDTKDSDTTNKGQQDLNKQLLAEAKTLNITLSNLAKYLNKDEQDITNTDLAKAIETKKQKLAEKQAEGVIWTP